jgi:uncharacterized membrane protein
LPDLVTVQALHAFQVDAVKERFVDAGLELVIRAVVGALAVVLVLLLSAALPRRSRSDAEGIMFMSLDSLDNSRVMRQFCGA